MKRAMALMLAGTIFLPVQSALPQSVRITVRADSVLRHINPWLYGVNTARWDESLFPGPANDMLLSCDRDAIEKIKAAGVTVLKYPGGNDADSYVWNAPSNNASEMDVDEYIALCRETGAEPFITVNFNEPPSLAAEWVRYCNVTRGYGVKLWEVGDEQWGWWAKGHAPPEQYAEKYVAFVKAMKDVDPTIRVATNVSLGPHPENWTERVLRAAGPYIDMLTVTYFPLAWGKENDDTLFASVSPFKEEFTALRRDVESIAGKKKAEEMLYVNVGYNSVNHSPGPQTLGIANGLWVADMIGAMATVGVDIACLWALHNFYPPRGGDFGFLSSDGKNTPRYTYYVFPMFTHHFGRDLLPASWADSTVSVYASRTGKQVSLIAINKNKHSSRSLDIEFSGFVPARKSNVWILDEAEKDVPLPAVPVHGGHTTITMPPYAMIAAEWISADSVVPPANLARIAHASASSFSTTWPRLGPASAIDGILYTRWNSSAWTTTDGNEKQSFRLKWDSLQTFDFIRIRWGETFAAEYTLEVSRDGTTWQDVADQQAGRGGVEEYSFAPVKARYLRMNGSHGVGGRRTISAYSIREMEVYNLKGRDHE